jgi:hypothetical protein
VFAFNLKAEHERCYTEGTLAAKVPEATELLLRAASRLRLTPAKPSTLCNSTACSKKEQPRRTRRHRTLEFLENAAQLKKTKKVPQPTPGQH